MFCSSLSFMDACVEGQYEQSMNYRLLETSGWALVISTIEVRKNHGAFSVLLRTHKNDLLPIWQPKPII